MNIKLLTISGLGTLGVGGGIAGTYYLSKINKPEVKSKQDVDELLKKWIDADENSLKEKKEKIKALVKEDSKKTLISKLEKGSEIIEKFKIESPEENSYQTTKSFCTENKKEEVIRKPENFEILKEICTK